MTRFPRLTFIFALLFLVTIMGGVSGYGRIICGSEKSTAALWNLTLDGVWWRASSFNDEAKLRRIKERITVTRQWAETLTDYCDRWAYLKWMDFAEDKIAEIQGVNKVAKEMTKPLVSEWGPGK